MDKKIDQKSYLQKYLSGSSEKKKKRKKPKGNGFKIIDDDVDYTKLRSLDDEELDLMNLGEDAPQIAGIIDERPEEIRKLEQFKTSSKWKVINQDDGFNSKIKVTEIKQTIKEKRKENEIVFGKMYSDSEEDGNKDGSDLSPPRHKETNKSNHKNNTKVLKSDSDISPPRNSKSVDSLHKKDKFPSSENDKYNNRKSNREKNIYVSDDSDHDPPRKHKSLKDKHKDRRKNGDSSPPNNPRRDSDESPPRKRKGHKFKEKKPNSDESDLSPPRRNNRKNKTNSDSDLSPCRKSQNKNYNSDQSPPRKKISESSKARKKSRWESDSKTLDGKKAGLQNSTQLQHENEAFRKREELAFTKMTDEVSGRNAQAVSRKAKRETSEDRRQQREKAENQKMLDEKYKVWNRGIKQMEAQEQRVQDYLHEASKPLARLRGDVDLERALKDEERDGDPMLDYIRDKKREMGDLPPERPTYKGNFPLNRFNIRPGYRWDGVDRSNGYENKYFENQSKRKAQEEEAYKWSSADL